MRLEVRRRLSGGNRVEMRSWLELALSAAVVRRAIKYAVVVGVILIAINHGDVILAGEVSLAGVLKMILTLFVPYAVSTSSSVAAMREINVDRI